MAKNTTQAEVVVTLNGQAARNELNRIEKEMQQYRDAAEEAYRAGNKALGDQMTKNAQRLEKEFKVAKKEMKDFSDTVKNMGTKSIKELEAAAKGLEKQLKTLSRKDPSWDQKKKQYQQVTRQLKEMKAEYKGIAKEEKALSGGFLKIGAAVGVAVAAVRKLAQAYKVIADFEQANANLATILGVNKNEMEELEKAALRLGRTTRYTATDVTNLQTELAKLGFTQKEIIDMAPATLNFATAVGTDLASAAQLAGVALRSFNLASDQTEDVLGTMAVACNKSALSFTYLQNAFSTIAPVAKTYGLSLKDTIALLGTLANAGFDASSAATATRNILLNLSDTNGKLAKALGGSVNSFDEIMDAMIKLREQGVDLNETLELTDKRSVAAFNTFLDGAESAKILRGELEDVNGELGKISQERADTVEGAIASMKSAWEGFVLSFRGSKGVVKDVIDFLTDGIRGLQRLIDPENTTVAEYADIYAERFRQFGEGTFTNVRQQRNLIEKEYKEMMKSLSQDNSKMAKHKMEALQKAYDRVMEETADEAEALEKKMLAINAEYDQKRREFMDKHPINDKTIDWKKAWKEYEAMEKERTRALNDALNNREKAEVKSAEKTMSQKKELSEKELAELKKNYLQKKTQLDAMHNYEEKALKVRWLKGEIGEGEYQSRLYSYKQQYYSDLLALARKYSQDNTSITNKMLDEQIKSLEAQKKRVKEELEEIAIYKEQLQAEDYSRFLDKDGKPKGSNNVADQEAYEKFQEKIWQKAADIRAQITDESARQEYETKVAWAEKLAEKEILTNEEAQKYILKAKIDYTSKAASQVNSILAEAANFVSALQDAELANLDADYQKQLSMAGDNAEKREELEKEYEQKKLDIQKKYADTDMVINIAKTIAAGALAAVQAFAQLGPIGGAVAADLIAATTAAEVAVIVAQRNAIKNSSVNSGGSSSGSTTTGQRVITGYSTGGYTDQAASDHKAVGIVHANEWVAPAWMVRSNPVTFANLESYRRSGSHGRTGSAATGFADGGYTGQQGGVEIYPADVEVLVYNAISRAMADGTIRANVVYQDLKSKENQLGRFNSQTSRN